GRRGHPRPRLHRVDASHRGDPGWRHAPRAGADGGPGGLRLATRGDAMCSARRGPPGRRAGRWLSRGHPRRVRRWPERARGWRSSSFTSISEALTACLESCRRIAYRDYEVIVVENGSPAEPSGLLATGFG